MRRYLILVTLLLLTVVPAVAVSVGSGAPSADIQQSFVNAWNRGQFQLLTTLPPVNDVLPLGSPGLVQEFAAKAGGTAKYALIKPDPTATTAQLDTLQVYSDIYTFFTSVGVATAGYPANDTTSCPTNSVGICNYQLFTKNYAFFVYSAPSVKIAVRDPFYTAWTSYGGVTGTPGVPTSAEATITSPSKIQATQQLFDGSAIFSYPVGSTTPTVHGVVEPFKSVFNTAGGYGVLGLPTSEALNVGSSGLTRQTFEYGRIEQLQGGTPNVLLALSEVDITFVYQGLSLNPGASATVSATTLDLRGTPVTDRVLTWNTTNATVATVTGNNYTAVVHGVSGGTANIYVTTEGKTSMPLSVRVGTVCCGIGEGAPSPAVTQAFQTAVSRNNLSVALPVAAPVTRQGTGYIQTLTAADGSGMAWVVAVPDNSANAWVMTGPLYSAYAAIGGFTGPLGYPASDILPGSVQKFTSGAALAGSPVRVIPAAIAAKWFQLGGIGGQPGAPAADAAVFASFSGVTGSSQTFAAGSILAISSGASAGQAYWSYGPILSRYQALSGPSGALGVPTSDVFTTGSVQQENFEFGYIDLPPGSAVAVEHFNPRHPAISVSPSTVVPGGRVHISATGFTPGATLAFTITGQPGFSVPSPLGAYTWDVVIPAAAKPATVAVQASAKPGNDAASATYIITPVAALLPKFTLLSGDLQTGAPGGLLPSPITAVLLDSTGAPIAGVPVSWTVSPGAGLQSGPVTDSNGRVSALFRLPPAAGVAVGSFAAGGQVVEFSALAAARSIQGFPAFAQLDQQGSLVAALSSLLRYYQNGGTLTLAGGFASPATLNAYLSANNGFAISDSGAALADPWVAVQFAKGGLFQEPGTPDHLLDLAGAGTPVAVVLRLSVDGALVGSAAVVVIGVNADGSLVISDPNVSFARVSLSDYLNGFAVPGHVVQGTVSSVLRVGPAQLPVGGAPFVIGTPVTSRAVANSPQGSCALLDLFDSAASGVRYLYCDGTQPSYQLDLAVSKAASIVDLAGGAPGSLPANGTLSWQLNRTSGALATAPQSLSVLSVTDSAAFGPALSPGGLFTIFGSGFSAGSAVTLGGKPVSLVAVFPFQINALLPADTTPGKVTLQVTGPLGTALKDIVVSAVSPGIFVVGPNAQGAILNLPDAVLNSPTLPAQRGQFISVYATGLGATVLKSGLQVAGVPVSALIDGVSVPASFSGLVAGFVGLYQVNIQLPASLPPSLSGTLALQQAGQTSNTVTLAVQ